MSVERIHASSAPGRNRGRGFTLLELCMTAAVIALLAAIALPGYASVIERQKVSQCRRDLSEIAMLIERYRTMHGHIPESLSELGTSIPKDAWQRDYRFLSFSSPVPGVMGKIRMDHNLHPLNTEFDLYSVGADGSSAAPLTAQASRDDVIWARDGGFVGLASDY